MRSSTSQNQSPPELSWVVLTTSTTQPPHRQQLGPQPVTGPAPTSKGELRALTALSAGQLSPAAPAPPEQLNSAHTARRHPTSLPMHPSSSWRPFKSPVRSTGPFTILFLRSGWESVHSAQERAGNGGALPAAASRRLPEAEGTALARFGILLEGKLGMEPLLSLLPCLISCHLD